MSDKKGVLYLNYYANMGVRSQTNKFRISKSAPEKCRVDGDLKGLHPANLLLQYFKEGRISWDDYRVRYVDSIMNSSEALEDIDFIVQKLESGEDVTLLCWEKFMPCHRFILGQLFLDMGYEVKSMVGWMLYDYEDGECYFEKGSLSRDFQIYKGRKQDECN